MRKTTSDGHEVELTSVVGGVAVTLDGRDLGSGRLVVVDIRSPRAVAYVDTTPKIGLTKTEWESLKAEIDVARAERVANRPAPEPTYEELVAGTRIRHTIIAARLRRLSKGARWT